MIQQLKITIVLICVLGMPGRAAAQYTFEMMNGRLLEVASYNDSNYVDIKYYYNKNSQKNERIRLYNEELRYELADKKGDALTKVELDSLVEEKKRPLKEPKMKEAFVEPAEVFAIHHPDGTKEVLYEYNEVLGNYYTVGEMQDYISGERDAIMRFKARRAFWGGVAAGAVGGFAWQNSIFTVTTPLVWTGIVAIPVIRIKDRHMSDPTLRTEPYKAGFAKTARTKNMIRGLQGSAIGTVAGALIYAVLANNTTQFR